MNVLCYWECILWSLRCGMVGFGWRCVESIVECDQRQIIVSKSVIPQTPDLVSGKVCIADYSHHMCTNSHLTLQCVWAKLHGSNGVEEKIDGLQEDEGIDEGGFLFQEDRCETWASTSFPNHEMPVLHKSLIQQWIHWCIMKQLQGTPSSRTFLHILHPLETKKGL